MSFLNIINDKLSEHGYASRFIPSYTKEKSELFDSYFFHHIKKCGGMSVFSAIAQSASYAEKIYGNPALFCKRLDQNSDWEAFSRYSKKNATGPMFISSHNAGDYYEALGHNIKRFSIFREPYSRARSEYQYHCMRKKINPDVDEFKAYILSDDCLRDYISPFIPSGDNVSVEKIKDILYKDFDAFFELKDIDGFLSYVVSKNNMPNIVMNKQNETMGQYKLPGDIDFKELFYENRKIEKDLFEWVKVNNRLPCLSSEEGLNVYTMILSSRQKEGGYGYQSRLVKTDDFIRHISAYKSISGLDDFFN